MAEKINLLPKDTSGSEGLEKISRIFKKLIVALFFIFVLVGGVGLGYAFYLSRELTSIAREKANLEQSIVNLESTEQGLVLIKNRLAKLNTIMNERNAFNSFIKQKDIADNLPEDVYFKSSKVDQSVSKLEMLSLRSKSLADLFSSLSESNKFSGLILEEINLNPFWGYNIILQVF